MTKWDAAKVKMTSAKTTEAETREADDDVINKYTNENQELRTKLEECSEVFESLAKEYNDGKIAEAETKGKLFRLQKDLKEEEDEQKGWEKSVGELVAEHDQVYITVVTPNCYVFPFFSRIFFRKFDKKSQNLIIVFRIFSPTRAKI